MDSKHGARGVAAVLTSLTMAGVGAALATAPAQSAAAAPGVCDTPFPLVDLTAGMLVDGLTVSSGTTPEPFTGEIVGVIENGIAPGLDMIMAELDSPAIAAAGGIWAGMSGSPVYAADDRLIGAVAYGLAFGSTPVAGITPYDQMDDWFTGSAAPATVPVSPRQARGLAAATDVSAAQAAQGFEQLPMQTSLSGVTAARLRKMKQDGPAYLALAGVRSAGATSTTAAAGPETLLAGGNLGAAYSYGDLTIGGVGTVTSTCNGELVGFGHPLDFVGRTTAGIMPADAVFVQRDPLGVPFKVANMGVPAGTLTQDRLTGISGLLGAGPRETHVTSAVRYRTRGRTGTSHSLRRDFNANVTFGQLLGNHDVVLSAIQGGTDTTELSITGLDADGAPFALTFSDRYTSRSDVAFASVFDAADLVFLLSRMRGVTVADVAADSTVTDATRTWSLGAVEQRRRRAWVPVGRRSPVVATAGRPLRLRAVLASGNQTQRVPLTLAVPRRAPFGFLSVEGGASVFDELGRPTTPAELAETLAGRVRNDEVRASLTVPRRRGSERVVTDLSGAQSRVVRGRVLAEVIVLRR